MIVGVMPSCFPRARTSDGSCEPTKRPAGTNEAPSLAVVCGPVDAIIVPRPAKAITNRMTAIRPRRRHFGIAGMVMPKRSKFTVPPRCLLGRSGSRERLATYRGRRTFPRFLGSMSGSTILIRILEFEGWLQLRSARGVGLVRDRSSSGRPRSASRPGAPRHSIAKAAYSVRAWNEPKGHQLNNGYDRAKSGETLCVARR